MSENLNMASASLFLFSQGEKLFFTTDPLLCLTDLHSFDQIPCFKYETFYTLDERSCEGQGL